LIRFVVATLIAFACVPAWALDDAKLWGALRHGGYVILVPPREHAARAGRSSRIQARRLRHATQPVRCGP
jgi:hypothetical protein